MRFGEPNPSPGKRFSYQTEHVGTTKLRRVMVQRLLYLHVGNWQGVPTWAGTEVHNAERMQWVVADLLIQMFIRFAGASYGLSMYVQEPLAIGRRDLNEKTLAADNGR